MSRHLHPDMAHMDGMEVLGHQQGGIAHAIVCAPTDLHVLLHTEKARHEALRGQALGVHVYVADGVRQLRAVAHGAEEGHLLEENGEAVVGVIAHVLAQGC